MFTVFTRTFWKPNASWPGGREPSLGRKYTIEKGIQTAEEARDICRVWNANHNPGQMSRKAEYTET
jgi:hypothetical protein